MRPRRSRTLKWTRRAIGCTRTIPLTTGSGRKHSRSTVLKRALRSWQERGHERQGQRFRSLPPRHCRRNDLGRGSAGDGGCHVSRVLPEGIPTRNISAPGGRDRRGQRHWFCKSPPPVPRGKEIFERHLVQV